MERYIARRLFSALVILFALSIVVFILLRIAGDPGDNICPFCPEPQREALREQLGLNDPYFPASLGVTPPYLRLHAESQYGNWVEQLATGRLGEDLHQAPVAPELQRRLPVTLELLIIAFLTTAVLGVALGVISAVYRNSPADYIVRVGSVLGLAVPGFWVATLVLLIPLQLWSYAPPLTHAVSFLDHPWDNLRQFVPPALVLGGVSSATVMRLTRSSMLEVLRHDYVRTARAKGLAEGAVIRQHVLKNSLVPVVTVLGLELISLFGGAVVVERIFNVEGVGKYFLERLSMLDYQVVQTLTLYTGAVVLLVNLTVDIVYAWLDPRIRYA